MKSWLIRKDPDAGKDWGQEEKGMTEDEMVRKHHWLNGCEVLQTPGNSQGQGSLACCSRWGHKESERTERLNNNYYSSLAHRLGFTTHCVFSKAQSMFHCCSYVAPEHHVMLLTTRPPLFSSLDFRNTYSSDFLSIPLASPWFPLWGEEGLFFCLFTCWHCFWVCCQPFLLSCDMYPWTLTSRPSHPCLQPRPLPWTPDLFDQWPLECLTSTPPYALLQRPPVLPTQWMMPTSFQWVKPETWASLLMSSSTPHFPHPINSKFFELLFFC